MNVGQLVSVGQYAAKPNAARWDATKWGAAKWDRDDMPWLLRLPPVVLIFALVGPLAGAAIVSLPLGALRVAREGSLLAFWDVFASIAMLAYGFGAALALLTGITVALSRICGGRTTIATPIGAAVLAYASGLALNQFMTDGLVLALLPASLSAAKLLLLPSILASVVCWLIARRVRLV